MNRPILAAAAFALTSACLLAALIPTPTAAQGAAWPQLALKPVISGLSRPVYMTHAGDGTGRVFVVEQAGRIRIFKNGALLPAPFLDISGRVSCCGERGLLGVAFPPGYPAGGHFYVYYTDTSGNIVVARYHVTADPDVANPDAEQVIITIPHPTYANHNGGQLAFGPNDGFLYFGTGDGGGAGDPSRNAQNPGVLLGKLLRVDVETGSPVTYTVPASNPYLSTPGYRPEIWALGVRNPWRFSFDRQTADLYVGDVGQGAWEEVDFQPASSGGGENYGWNILEGTHCYPPGTATCTPPARYAPPIEEYSHADGCSIAGGYVYRGIVYPRMQGVYFYADSCSGHIWGLRRDASTWQSSLLYTLSAPTYNITTFGQDEPGNLFVADYADGTISELVDPGACCDFDRNGQVDILDVMRVAAAWGTDSLLYDFNLNGTVDIADIQVVTSHWGESVPVP